MYSSVNLIVVVGRDVLLELFERLSAQVAAVHQEQHAPGAGELDQPVAEDDGGQVLPEPVAIWISARGRLSRKRLLEVHDRLRLGRPEIVDQRRHVLDAGEKGAGALAVIRGTIGGLQLRRRHSPAIRPASRDGETRRRCGSAARGRGRW